MFNVGDRVEFGLRYPGELGKPGVIRSHQGIVRSIKNGPPKNYIFVESDNRLYRFRQLKSGWVAQPERDDPKGRLSLVKI